jgi:hypothetical protein
MKRKSKHDEKRDPGRRTMYPGKVRRPNSVILTDEAREMAEAIAAKLSKESEFTVSRSDAIENCIRIRAAQFGLG